MNIQAYITKWRNIYAQKNERIHILSKRLCEASTQYVKQSILQELQRTEAEAYVINNMLLELETEVE